ncbi:hypothetical protein E6O75_ATG10763 [Venturia nashicola]|uniref:Fungal N-terminal domain-containing protein n=1 Tax=Venturia nashicola TaxID=86259 RepID=A0A4Z1PG27_9PEZI|nr:hypothetical protein E6O75_ATG10763 [Venturia nashicola]
MAGLAAGIVGVVSAGTKVAIVLSQYGNEVGAAGQEARMIASEIRGSCTVLTTLHSTLKHVQKSPYYANCAELIIDMTDASLEMYTEIMEVVEGLSAMTSDSKMNLRKRLLWTFQKPKIVMLRTALEAYRSNLALMLGTLDMAEKASRSYVALTEEIVQEDEMDCAKLQDLQLEQRMSLLKVQELDPEDIELPSSPTGAGQGFWGSSSKESAFPVEKGYVSALREEIATLKRSRTVYETDPEKVRDRVARQSNRLSQLLVQDQRRISRRWSQSLPERRMSMYSNFAAARSRSPTSPASSSSASPSESSDDLSSDYGQVNEPMVRDFYAWMCAQTGVQRSIVLRQLQARFGDGRGTTVGEPVNGVGIHPGASEDTLCADVSKLGLEKNSASAESDERQAEAAPVVEASKEKKRWLLKRSMGLKRRTPSAS